MRYPIVPRVRDHHFMRGPNLFEGVGRPFVLPLNWLAPERLIQEFDLAHVDHSPVIP